MTHKRNQIIFIFLSFIFCFQAFGQEEADKQPPPGLLREGFVLSGVEGVIEYDPDEPGRWKWFFVPDEDVSDNRARVSAGRRIKILECSMLDNIMSMTGYGKEETPEAESESAEGNNTKTEEKKISAPVRLWARVTKYSHSNYLFLLYFIPMTESETSPGTAEDVNPKEQQGQDNQSENNDDEAELEGDSILPAEVMERLKPQRVVNLAKMKKWLEQKGDMMIVDREGVFERKEGQLYFRIDGLGMNVNFNRFSILPSGSLSRVNNVMSSTVWKKRFRISGIITRFEGNNYLLLQKAVRRYSHGNFDM